MSLQLAAQHLASRGRGPDTQLIHMAPQEVAGLQALAKAHGGSLTTNPDTGLPEAGFLSSILPMVIGGALVATGVGAPLAAGIVGAGYGAATGSLKKGLMAGLGAYGGAGLAGGLMGAGAGAAQQAAMAGASEAAASPLMGMEAAALENPAVAGLQAANASPAYNVMTGGFGVDPGLGVPPTAYTPPTIANQAVTTTTQAPALSQQGLMNQAAARVTPGSELFSGSGFDTAKAGLGEVMKDPSRFMTKENLQYGLAGLAPMMSQQTAMAQRPQEYPEYYSFDAGYLGGPSATGNYFAPTLTRLPRRAADGGMMDSENAGIASLAQGGPSHLGDYSDGGRLLRGPGDGVSDSIPASIGGKQPARLADGEFVVPARIVSELGNGSTEAGARKLYAMMDRVQKARSKTVGKDRVATNTKTEKLLPA